MLPAQRISRVVSGDVFQYRSAIAYGFAENTEVIGRKPTGSGNIAKTAHPSVRRLEPDGSAKRRGIPYRTGVVGSDGAKAKARGHRRSGAATGTTGDSLPIPGIMGGTIKRINSRSAAGPFMHIGFAEYDGSRFFQSFYYGCIMVRYPLC